MNSSVALMTDLGFDGLEIDWESPKTSAEAENLITVLCGLRDAMDAVSLAQKLRYKFTLTASVHANPPGANEAVLGRMARYLDYMSLSMSFLLLLLFPSRSTSPSVRGNRETDGGQCTVAYDYAGSFTNLTGHASNLRPSASSPLTTPFSTRRALGTYIRAGVPLPKLLLGMPLYGRSFLETTGLGQTYSGVGNGSFEPGVYDYKDLPLAGAKEIYDEEVGASYSFGVNANGTMAGYGNATMGEMKGTLVSYDNKAAVEAKARYIVDMGLGGAMWWESSGDKVGEESLIGTVAGMLGTQGMGMDKRENLLTYPMSRYANLRGGMNGE